MEGYNCIVCGKELSHEEVIWADAEGNLTTATGDPYCPACLPEQGE